jgi:hypothetical protein
MDIIIKKIDKDKIQFIKKNNFYKINYNDVLNILGLPIKIKFNNINEYNNLYYIYLDIKDTDNVNLLLINDYFNEKLENFILYRTNNLNYYIICNNYKNININNIKLSKYIYITINKIKNIKNNNIPIINIL